MRVNVTFEIGRWELLEVGVVATAIVALVLPITGRRRELTQTPAAESLPAEAT